MTEESPSNGSPSRVDFSTYSQGDYTPGYGPLVRCLWWLCSLLLFESGLCPVSGILVFVLRGFGARIGQHVVVKPNVRIKFPWRLVTGDHVWIGQGTWIDNLAEVTLGSHVCLSQNVYLCTGSHDHHKPSFDLITKPITVADGGWICAGSILLPGTTVGREAIVSAGSVAQGEIPEGAIVKGNPAVQVGGRTFDEPEASENSAENPAEAREKGRT
jgi:putative colanic acid biosynthesis acetyltransferase WcaF